MKVFQFKEKPAASFKPGTFSFISVLPNRFLEKIYGENRTERRLGLKVFKKPIRQDPPQKSPADFYWKNTPLLQATQIQNVFYMEGMAPRVFDIVQVQYSGETHYAQVTEVLEDDERGKRLIPKDKIVKVRKKYKIRSEMDPNPNHQYQEYFCDFSSKHFVDDSYKKFVINIVKEQINWGSNPKPYQSVPELEIDGQRNLRERVKAYDFDNVDFFNKTVIDYGCSGGHMCFDAIDRGAKYAVGVDLPHTVEGARHLANYLGYFNVDFYGGNFSHKNQDDVYEKIKNLTGEDKFDFVFYFSSQQLGMPDYLPEITGEYFYLEGHSGDHDYTYQDQLEAIFGQSNVEFLGASHDHSTRPVFRCSS